MVRNTVRRKCLYCEQNLPANSRKERKFCNHSCSISHRNKVFSLKEAWKKRYGDAWEERWNTWIKKMSEVTTGDKNPMFGKHDHVHGLKRYAKEKTGKSLEEVHGIELAQKIRSRRSEMSRGSKNPAYGKVYQRGGKSVKGYYKSLFFRSLLEYSFMKHMESEGLTLHTDVDYECFSVPYVFEGQPRTYCIDFYVSSRRVAYEVKPSYVIKKVSAINEAKWSAAREYFKQRGVEFCVVTDLDFPKIAFNVARQDNEVKWKEETFKYFKGSVC